MNTTPTITPARKSLRRFGLAGLLAWALSSAAMAAPAPPALPPALPPPPAGFRWQRVPALTDEFGGRRLDTRRWLTHHPYWNGREPSRFEPANVGVSGGELRLRSDTLLTDLSTVKDPDKDVWVRAACLSSPEPLAGFGYYEARLKASDLSMTSSFWLQGKFSEIDVVEQVGRSAKNPDKDRQMLMNTHFFRDGWEHDQATPRRWTMPSGASQDYHVYGVWWKDANTVIFYHDRAPVAQVKTGGAFTEPMYLFFDTEVFTVGRPADAGVAEGPAAQHHAGGLGPRVAPRPFGSAREFPAYCSVSLKECLMTQAGLGRAAGVGISRPRPQGVTVIDPRADGSGPTGPLAAPWLIVRPKLLSRNSSLAATTRVTRELPAPPAVPAPMPVCKKCSYQDLCWG